MQWPPQSPDLNPIEKLWDELKRRVQGMQQHSKADLWRHLQTAWDEISTHTIRKLISRMPKLVNVVIKKRGGHIDENKI